MIKKELIVDNLKIVYYENGEVENSPLVFLHGWKSEASVFHEVLERVGSYVAINLPGFGGSQKPESTWGVGEYADFLKKFLNKLNIKNSILVGHSFGGSVIIKYLAQGGEAKRAILIDSAGVRKRGGKVRACLLLAKIVKIFFLIPGFSSAKEKLRRWAYKLIGSTDYVEAGEMREIYEKIISEDLSGEMKRIGNEIILIWGENDEETPLEQAKIMNGLMRNSRLEIINGVGHFPFVDKKEEFLKVFLGLISTREY